MRDAAGREGLQRYALVGVLILGIVARTAGIGFGLPNTEARPDETVSVSVAVHMAKSGLHPHSFLYPNLFPHLLLFCYGVCFILGYVSGQFASLEAFKALYYTDPSAFYLIARVVSAACGVLTVCFVYLLGKRLYGTSVGLLAALFLALCPIHVRSSHFGNVDVPMVCLMALAALFILDVYRRGGLRDYLLSGAVSGLATSTKYPAGILCLSILAAHLLREGGERGWRKLLHPYLWAAALAMVGAFLCASPYILTDWKGFWGDFQKVGVQLVGKHGDSGEADYGNGWLHHITFSFRYGLGLTMEVFAAAGVVWVALRRRAEDLVLLSFFVYLLLLGNERWIYARYILPLVPVAMIIAAAFLLRVGDLLKNQRLRTVALCATGTVLLAEPTYHIVHFDRILLREDTRLQAAAWIRSHVPDGASIALHGGYSGEPPLPESEEMLRERLRGQRGPNRDTYLLEHPIRPRYRLIRLGYFYTAERVPEGWVEMSYDWAVLRDRGIDYVVTQESPLRAFAAVDERMRGTLEAHAAPLAVFDPFAPGSSPRPVYDPIDAFFVPMAGFAGVERPGPKITIYRLDPLKE